jgi:uncharacterized protein YjbI with pentapeptide repeats
VLQDKVVVGTLDLRHHRIGCAVEIRDCEFLDAVDLRYCEFTQAVDFSGCTFRKALNSGDEVESHTVYRKDLVCKRAVFEALASFNGCRVEGSMYFSGAEFRSHNEWVDFRAASVGKTFECLGSTFYGLAIFAGLECDAMGFFARCSFNGPGPVLFSSAIFGNNLACDEAVLSGHVNMERLTCGGGAAFRGTRFTSLEGANFVQIDVGSNLEFQEASFQGLAIFNSIKCGLSGFFNKAVFSGSAEFGFARFGGVFDCPGSFFLPSLTSKPHSKNCDAVGAPSLRKRTSSATISWLAGLVPRWTEI